MNSRDLEFLFEIGSLKNIERGWRQHLAMECANNLEHSFRVAFIALLIAQREGTPVNQEKLLKMALLHDLAEARTADLSYVQKVYTTPDEERAAQDMFAGTSFQKELLPVLEEYEERESIEAKIVKDADNLDVDFELKELQERGSQLPKKWEPSRRLVREQKFYTGAAKAIWDELQNADVSSWHLLSNKWYKIPHAGK